MKFFWYLQDFYNFLLDSGSVSTASAAELGLTKGIALRRYSKYLTSLGSSPGGDSGDLDSLLNGVIKKKLKIIPENVT